MWSSAGTTFRHLALCFLLALSFRALGAGSPPLSDLMSEAEFTALAARLSHKVNLFADAWRLDASAEFYGGTTRDYLYWLRGQFRGARSRADIDKEIARLEALRIIDIRDFIIGESDIDIVADKRLSLSAADYGMKKIDSIKADRFDPATPAGRDELLQGYIPVEKIRLGSRGFVTWKGVGNGLHEIFEGPITVRFAKPEDFAKTEFAAKKLNHPVLLALRYLRLAAIDYFKKHGGGAPNPEILFDLDRASADAVRAVLVEAARTNELEPYLANERFRTWLNQTVKKAFLSYTNPTAAKLLFDRFGVELLVSRYPGIEPYNQYLFSRYPEPERWARTMEALGTSDKALFIDPARFFPDGKLFHGTKSDSAYRAILFQGILPSTDGTGGAGLYGVGTKHKEFAVKWAGTEDRVVEFEVSPKARIVDITTGEGKAAFEKFEARFKGSGSVYDAFSDALGIDILRYPYGETVAFAVKNSDVLSKPKGYRVELLSLSKILERAAHVRTPEGLDAFLTILDFNPLSRHELELVLGEVRRSAKDPEVREAVEVFEEAVRGKVRFGPLPPLSAKLLSHLIGYSPELDQVILNDLLPRLEAQGRMDPNFFETIGTRRFGFIRDYIDKLAPPGKEPNREKIAWLWRRLGSVKIPAIKYCHTIIAGGILAPLGIEDADPAVREAALGAAIQLEGIHMSRRYAPSEPGRAEAKKILHDVLAGHDTAAKVKVIKALAQMREVAERSPDWTPVMKQLLKDPAPEVRVAVISWIQEQIDGARSERSLHETARSLFPSLPKLYASLLEDPDPAVKTVAASALWQHIYWEHKIPFPKGDERPWQALELLYSGIQGGETTELETRKLVAARSVLAYLLHTTGISDTLAENIAKRLLQMLDRNQIADARTRAAFLYELGRFSNLPKDDALYRRLALTDPDEHVRAQAAQNCLKGSSPPLELLPAFQTLLDRTLKARELDDYSAPVFIANLELTSEPYVEAIVDRLDKEKDPDKRDGLVQLLATTGGALKKPRERCLGLLTDHSDYIRITSAKWYLTGGKDEFSERAFEALLRTLVRKAPDVFYDENAGGLPHLFRRGLETLEEAIKSHPEIVPPGEITARELAVLLAEPKDIKAKSLIAARTAILHYLREHHPKVWEEASPSCEEAMGLMGLP